MEELRGRDFLALADFTAAEIHHVVDEARRLKKEHQKNEISPVLKGKNLAMLFMKPSTRTRVAFEVGMNRLGGDALYLSAGDLQLGRGETIADTARVLSRYVDAVLIRTFAHDEVVEFAENADVPVINGLTDALHPTQVVADLLTLVEVHGRLEGLTLAYVGDGNNVSHSLMIAAAKLGIEIRVATPGDLQPDGDFVALAQSLARAGEGAVRLLRDPVEAVSGADAVYTDVWVSMGQEGESQKRELLDSFQVTEALMASAGKDAVFLHCLPAHRGEEVTGGVIDGPSSVVFDQAENRLHAHMAILSAILPS